MGLYSSVIQDSYSAQSELDVFIPELWADAIRASFKQNLVLGRLANDYSYLLAGSGNKINIPTIADVSAAAEKTENDAVTYATPGNEDDFDITCDQHYYTAAMIEDMGVVQSKADLLSKYANSMATFPFLLFVPVVCICCLHLLFICLTCTCCFDGGG